MDKVVKNQYLNKFTTPGRTKSVEKTILAPENSGLRLILNTCSQSGKYDSKFSVMLTKKWTKAKEDYRSWFVTKNKFLLGTIHTTAVASDIWITNVLVADENDALDNEAVVKGLKKVAELAKYENASVHVSEMTVETIPGLKDLMKEHLLDRGVSVYFYTEPAK